MGAQRSLSETRGLDEKSANLVGDIVEDIVEDMAEDLGTRSLIWAALGDRACDDDEDIEEETERGHSEDNGCDGDIDLPKIAGEGTSEEQQRSLQHQRQRLHHMVEVPGDDTIEFALPVLTAFDGGTSHVGRFVTVQPLFAEHREKGGEERDGETREEDGLDVDHHVGRARPLWEGRHVVAEGGVIDLVNEDTEESDGLIVWVRLELRVDLDDECGGDGGE